MADTGDAAAAAATYCNIVACFQRSLADVVRAAAFIQAAAGCMHGRLAAPWSMLTRSIGIESKPTYTYVYPSQEVDETSFLRIVVVVVGSDTWYYRLAYLLYENLWRW